MASFENPTSSGAAMEAETPVVETTRTIVTIDGVEFKVNSNLLNQSEIMKKTFLDASGNLTADDSPLQIIPTSQVFEKILQFMEKNHSDPMKDIPKPLGDTTVHKFFASKNQTFYSDFVKEMEPALLHDVTEASSCLNIEALTELCAATYATIIKENPDPRRLAQLLNIELPSSSEERSDESGATGKGAGNA